MKNKPTAMHLEANFDIDQIGETLEWSFSRLDGQGDPIKGKYAGSIYFTVGEKLRIRVKAGNKAKFDAIAILDCCLITRPQITSIAPGTPPTFADPSPFVNNDNSSVNITGACVTIPASEFVDAEVHDPDPHYFEIAKKWDSYLTVGQAEGRWEFSFVLTVLITRGGGIEPTKRVFVFDPEGEVGSNVNPPTLANALDDVGQVASAVMPEGEMGAGGLPT